MAENSHVMRSCFNSLFLENSSFDLIVFFFSGVLFMFLTGFLIAVVVLVSFLVGVVAQRVVCDPLKDHENSQVFHLIDDLNFTEYGFDVSVSQALTRCYKNESIYKVLNLSNKFNLDEVKNYLNSYGINQTLAELDIGTLINGDFKILSDKDKDLLNHFANSSFADINFDEFKDLVRKDIFLYYFFNRFFF